MCVCNMKNKKADMGLGTLIIFIAMILVAAVASSVLIATSSKLQNKALDTGKLTTKEVGTGLHAIAVYAEDGSNQNLEYWYFSIKLAAGSDALRFNDVLLTMGLSDTTGDYIYNQSIACLNTTTFSSYSSGYGVYYSLNGTTHKNGYLNKGDVSRLCFASPRTISEGENIKIQLVPKVGSILTVSTYTPDLITEYRTEIFP